MIIANSNGNSGDLRRAVVRLVRKHGRSEVLAAAQEVEEAALDKEVMENGITLRAASRKYDVPVDFLWRWAREGHIDVLRKGVGPGSPTYMCKKAAEEAASLYHRAKSEGKRPTSLLLKRMPN